MIVSERDQAVAHLTQGDEHQAAHRLQQAHECYLAAMQQFEAIVAKAGETLQALSTAGTSVVGALA